jgi:hypothetical protein
MGGERPSRLLAGFSIWLHCRQQYGIKAAPQPPLSGGFKVIGGSENLLFAAAIFPLYQHGPKVWRYGTSVAMAENHKRDSGRDNTNRRASLVALGVVVVLFVIGWILTRELYSNQKIEDCVLSGRTNCVTIDTNTSSY